MRIAGNVIFGAATVWSVLGGCTDPEPQYFTQRQFPHWAQSLICVPELDVASDLSVSQ